MTTVDPATLLSFRRSLTSCTTCDISSTCTAPVPFYGDLTPALAIMGEAPGRQEDEAGEPFVGPTGYHLKLWLRTAGIDLDDITYFNAVSCYPARTPTNAEVDNCRPWVHGQLEFIRPRVLLTMGAVAYRSIRQNKTKPALQVMHGKVHYLAHNDTLPIISTYHPMAYLRGKNAKYLEMIKADLDVVRKTLQDGVTMLEECYCGDELYRFDECGIGLCRRHSQHQGLLWPEDAS